MQERSGESMRMQGQRSRPLGTQLRPEVIKQIAQLGAVEIVVGVPSFNNATTIEHVVRAIKAGLARYFPSQRALLVNSDGGSHDGTPEIVRSSVVDDYGTLLTAHPLHPVHKIITPYHGLPGKGSALRTIFQIATELHAKGCAVVDADLRSITPQWIDLLLGPVLKEGFDYVAPLYLRHKYDGTITNSIVYPLTRSLYGQRVRQPIGGDFGFSGQLAEHYLTHDVWHTDVARFGVDIWMTTTALTGGFRLCQSFLGAKIHDPKDPGVDLSAMLRQVVGSVFSLMETNEHTWREIRHSVAVPLFGFEYSVGLEPVQVNVERMLETFKRGVSELGAIWEAALSASTYRQIISAGGGSAFDFPDELWTRTVYEFAVAWRRHVVHREHLLQSLTPLYLGRVASFVLSTAETSAADVELRLEALCLEFEKQKPYLIERWDA